MTTHTPEQIEQLAARLAARTVQVLPANWRKERRCPECDSLADRPKCLLDLGGGCPRSNPDNYDPSPYVDKPDADCVEAALALRSLAEGMRREAVAPVALETLLDGLEALGPSADGAVERDVWRALNTPRYAPLIKIVRTFTAPIASAPSYAEGRRDGLEEAAKSDEVQAALLNASADLFKAAIGATIDELEKRGHQSEADAIATAVNALADAVGAGRRALTEGSSS